MIPFLSAIEPLDFTTAERVRLRLFGYSQITDKSSQNCGRVKSRIRPPVYY